MAPTASPPLVSLVIATYNVAPYLPAFLASLDRQTADRAAFEAVFVNDGSTDESGELLAAWSERTACRHSITTIENGGAANARNVGMDLASGEWLTFCDSDDVLADNYLGAMVALLQSEQADGLAAAVGNFIYLEQATGQLRDTHPLRFRVADGDRVVDLGEHPNFVHLATNTGFYRRSVVEEHHIRMDPRIRPVFEDAHFTAVYLSHFDPPRIAFMRSAVYQYRRGRADGSSLMQGAWADEGKFTKVPEFGWLDFLRRIHAEQGRVPAWAQNIVLYDLFWYLRQDRNSPSPITAYSQQAKDRIHEVLAEMAPYLDRETIETFSVNKVLPEWRTELAMALKGPPPGPPVVVRDRTDRDRGVVRYHYYFTGTPPVETIRAGGQQVEPVYAKIRTHTFAGVDMMYERILWLPLLGTVELALDGEVVTPVEPPRAIVPAVARTGRQGAAAVRTGTDLRDLYRAGRARVRRRAAVVRARGMERIARSPLRRRYDGAWLFLDRELHAQDNAEHLYRHVRAEHPSVNAWFVLSPASPDWARLQGEGFRLIEYGSLEHTLAMLGAKHLISSQLDQSVLNPPNLRVFGNNLGPASWTYTFLQHGVTKDDLSNWMNTKPIELMITVTPQEQASIVADYTPYVFTTREVRLTGFPRHDRLLTLAQDQDPATRTILVTPTWRRDLVDFTGGGAGPRPLVPGFWQSAFGTQWQAFLDSPQLAEAARASGWRVVFLPHPLIQDCLVDHPLPAHVEVRRFGDDDIQQTIAEAAVVVTDYSSNAFEAAYLQRPVVYFQFDQDEFFGGGHAYTRGDWSYTDDGFGPVVLTASAAAEEVAAVMARDGAADPVYAERMDATFPFRDGRCSERTYQAIADLTRPLGVRELYRPVRMSPTGTTSRRQVGGR